MTYPVFTYSNYSTLSQCPQKFKLAVIDKIPGDQDKSVALNFGTALHAGLNMTLTERDKELAQNVFEEYWLSLKKNLDFKNERHSFDDLLEMGIKFVGRFNDKYAKEMHLVEGEKRIYDALGLTKVEGTPDALVEWNNKTVLLDFKTSAYNYDLEKIRSSLQLNLYAHLLTRKGYKVDAICYFVFNKATGSIQTPIIEDYKEKRALLMITDAIDYYNKNVQNTNKNSTQCFIGKNKCPYFERCWDDKG